MVRAHPALPLTREVVYPESPRWRDGRIWFSDVHDYRLKTVDLGGHLEVVAYVPNRPAGLGFLPDGRLLVATALDLRLWTLEQGELREQADLSALATGLLNDMVVATDGAAYVGDTGFARHRGEPEQPGRIVLRDVRGRCRTVAEELAFPNGMAISLDRSTLWVAETSGQRVTRFTIQADGSLCDRHTTAELDFRPDGLCLDRDDNVWVAGTRARAFVQLASDGREIRRVPAPGATAVACVFAGPERERLALLSADTTPANLAQGISHGRIDLIDVQASGGGIP
jgi:sugar lactone lactonase YvrE